MNGAELRLARLFNKASGRAFVVAVDRGLSSGVVAGAEDAEATVAKAVAGRPEGVILTPGLLPRVAPLLGHSGAPAALLRIDFITYLDPRLKPLGEHYRVLCTPEDALRMGADGLIMFFILGPEPGAMLADNAEAITRTVARAHAAGLPVMVEVVLWGSRVSDQTDPDLLAFGCRMAAELGADTIKTQYTGDPATMAEIARSCPAPVFILGGPKSGSEEELLAVTADAMRAGCRGVVYGRNVWQSDDPVRTAAAIRRAVHGEGA